MWIILAGALAALQPALGQIAFEYSAFAIDGRPDLGMIVYNPATPEEFERVRALVEAS